MSKPRRSYKHQQQLLFNEITKQYGSISAFAEQASIPRSSIYNYLGSNGNFARMPVGMLIECCEKLSLSPDQLLIAKISDEKHIEALSEMEYIIIKRYREDCIFHQVIDKLL